MAAGAPYFLEGPHSSIPVRSVRLQADLLSWKNPYVASGFSRMGSMPARAYPGPSHVRLKADTTHDFSLVQSIPRECRRFAATLLRGAASVPYRARDRIRAGGAIHGAPEREARSPPGVPLHVPGAARLRAR